MKELSTGLPRAVEMAHLLVKSRLDSGDLAVDATVGNGHDTAKLAELVGPEGRVVGFDIQESAIAEARKKLADQGQVELYHTGHENLSRYVEGSLSVGMFNLGYLPGSDKSTITQPGSTIEALEQLCGLLKKRGIITIVIYTGHEGGAEEASAVEKWTSELDQAEFSVIKYAFVNQRNTPPSLIVVEKKG